MAASSIFANVIISGNENVERFADALEASSREPEWKPSKPVRILENADEIRRFLGIKDEKNN